MSRRGADSKVAKVYTLEENLELLDRVIRESESEEFLRLKEFNVRFAVIYVSNVSDDGEVLPAFKTLPYVVKINSPKDKCVKHVDVEIYIDEAYFAEASDREKEAVIFGALNQIEIKYKNDMPVFQNDGTVKLSLKQPDMVFAGFSECAKKYGDESPERETFRQLTAEFGDILF